MTVVAETMAVAEALTKLIREGKSLEAVERFYSDEIVSIEAGVMPGEPEEKATTVGIEGIRKKHAWWYENHEVHSSEVIGPFPHGDRFALTFKTEVTPKATGEKMTFEEVALYTVADGKIVKEEFFYSC